MPVTQLVYLHYEAKNRTWQFWYPRTSVNAVVRSQGGTHATKEITCRNYTEQRRFSGSRNTYG